MNSRDITIIILLLIILAVLYKMMQGAKLQTELATGMAKKLGVEIKKPKPQREIEEEEETEDVEHEEEETEEEETEEEENQENEEKNEEEEEVEVQEEDANGKKIGTSRAVVLKVTKPKKAKKVSKLKAYEEIATVFDNEPLQSGEIMARYEKEFEKLSSNEFWLTLNYAIKKGLIRKHVISESPKKNIYGLPEMFDGDELKEEFKENLPK